MLLWCGAGMAMVPFADLFNHKAAVVQLAGGYFVEDICMEGAESLSDEESDDPDDASEGFSDVGDPKDCQNGAVGDSGGDETASTKVKPKTWPEAKKDLGGGWSGGACPEGGGGLNTMVV